MKIDKPFLYISIALFCIGLVILGSASAVLAEKNYQNTYYYILHQLLYGGTLGLLGFFLGMRIPFSFWRKMAVPLMLFSLILSALLFIPQLGVAHGGATRWLALGSFSFQPSEILKFAFIVYLASWLESKREHLGDFSSAFIPFIIIMAIVSVFLIMQPDIGTLGVMILSAVVLYFFGGGKISQFATLVVLGVVMLFLLIQLAPYRLDRLTVFLNPGSDPQGKGYQINQAFIAIGSGGFSGVGFGGSREKYSYLPEPIGDSIFAIFAEEFGFLGVLVLISLFLMFLWRGFHIAARAPTVFGKFLAIGLTSSIVIQSFINIGAISGLLPLTGIPLPFISYGSTSLVMTMTIIGIMLNISKHA